MADRPPGWVKYALREFFLGVLGVPGDGRVPRKGWLRYATIGFYVALAATVVALVIALR